MKIKTTFYFALRSTCITFILRKEDKRRLGNENKNPFYFALRSTCIIFAISKHKCTFAKLHQFIRKIKPLP